MAYMSEEELNIQDDDRFMKIAIEQAEIAEENGDVPIGAVIVYQNQIIGKAYNQREQLKDPTAHAANELRPRRYPPRRR